MNTDVQAVCNKLVYNGALRCGSPGVASSRFVVPAPDAAPSCDGPVDWLQHMLDPEHTVVLANTDTITASSVPLESRGGGGRKRGRGEAEQGGDIVVAGATPLPVSQPPARRRGICNETEAVLVATVVRTLVMCGCAASDIGVIAPYRAQLQLIRQLLSRECAGVDVETVDRFQGRDKRCVIVSLVRSNNIAEVCSLQTRRGGGGGGGHVKRVALRTGLTLHHCAQIGPLLHDVRRVNVAFSRAKSKLVVFGSRSTLEHSASFASLFALGSEKGWVRCGWLCA